MENRSPILRFGITKEGRRSSYWRVRAGMKQPELFLETEGYGKKWHFSLHASKRWHMKEGRKERLCWDKPDEVVPGYTRAVGLVQPVVDAQTPPRRMFGEAFDVPLAPHDVTQRHHGRRHRTAGRTA